MTKGRFTIKIGLLLNRIANTMSVRLRQGRDHLEERGQQRTTPLESVNRPPEQEMAERTRIEQAPQSEHDFAQSLIETAQAIILVLDTQGRIVRFNRYMEELSGYRLDEVRGKDWFATFLPERDRDRIRELFLKAIGGVATRGSVDAIVAKDGRELNIEWNDKSLKEAHGNTVGLLSIGLDVTERKRAEELLRESEEHFRAVAETASDAIISVNGQGAIVFWNRAAERMFGYLAEEAAGMPLGFLVPERFREAHLSRLQRVAATGEPRISGMATEVVGIRRDGGEFALELSLAAWHSGDSAFFTAICRDISERKRPEEALRESEQRYRTLFDGVPIGLYRTSPEGQFIDANPAFAHMLGYPDREALQATNAADAYADARERERWRSTMEREASARDCEMEILRPDGSVIWVRDKARVVRDPAGRVLYYEGSLEDISERKQAEEVLRSQSLKDDVTGLYNRRGFLALAEQQMKVAQRKKSIMLLFFADLDGMKWINDTLGHQEGDRALIAVAAILKNTFRESDIVARLGGDEFAFLALDTAADAADTLASRLQDALDAHNARGERAYTLSLSMGVASYDPQHPCSVHELLARADSLMYEHKRGKNG